jgi:carbon monoxide dehydrogenase subunit G
MGTLHLTRETSAPPEAVWEVLTDFAAYGRWMPLTRMRVDPGAPRLGWGFAGFSGLGRLGFTDSMLVTGWAPPVEGNGRFRVVKTGRVLSGWADISVTALDGGGTRLDWTEDVLIKPLPFRRSFDPLLDRASRWLYARAIDAMLAEAQAQAQAQALAHRTGTP